LGKVNNLWGSEYRRILDEINRIEAEIAAEKRRQEEAVARAAAEAQRLREAADRYAKAQDPRDWERGPSPDPEDIFSNPLSFDDSDWAGGQCDASDERCKNVTYTYLEHELEGGGTLAGNGDF
jgi:membrane protein involved in colicin uptake